MDKELKIRELKEKYAHLKGISDSIAKLEKLCVGYLFDLISKCGTYVCVQTDGIPHTAIDYNDEEDGTPKHKQIDSLYSKHTIDGDVIIVTFTDGTESDSVAFDDIAYLVEELEMGFVYEDIKNGEDNQ